MDDFVIYKSLQDLDEQAQELIQKAKQATDNAYAPYSNFFVGAALLLEDGSIVTGTNQENAAYPSGMCAERVALYSAISQNPQAVIKRMAVVARKKDFDALTPATSCGQCRQVMLEFEFRQHKPYEILMQNQERQWVKASSARSLLPFCFTNESL
ncbi:cytidine deaminase [Chryseosolibacter indicus]|uniref:Cytidine deaminase n=1 Tax=Chryseosolibacter indicus TaxID=2782351 RepID=A0ABS5VMX9_9BACT|nr:cytidine deaminase [Chryseosolibacter indicus]MBT1702805.1 cytidine deaminase [Chryseosolibacter indicus]